MLAALALLSLAIWTHLLAFRGGFWRADQRLPRADGHHSATGVVAVVPARDEEAVVGEALRALLAQEHGNLRVVLVDDHSRDRTRAIADAVAADHPGRLTVTGTEPLPPGWTGKLWALAAGVRAARAVAPDATHILLCDADIRMEPDTLPRLLAKAEPGVEAGRLDLVSLMVRLDDRGFWGGLLVPAFVFFFQMLYPFPWVNDPRARTAAAAGGCVLVRRDALERAGGIEAIRGALIDDCTLAAAVKRAGGRIWLGLADSARSLRDNGGFDGVWNMVARTAYTQLHHSPLLLIGTLAGMALTFLVPPLLALALPLHGNGWAAAAGLAVWVAMGVAYSPTLRLYGRPIASGLLLPLVAALYSLMTVASALRHWRGRGGQWKGRVYPADGTARGG
ncbi:glycosyltransferase [Azospirillum sp. RWY-5-1]|uniref:Glycosyltransferase n=1 Tax=Azospirillum oleiclasticum TaxID=2735135 RepID=A0ABX2TJV4_9PROT|nr:glycosyltransferase [Azospirillum oleiclasticum]NYZ16710.1 glycosyltransferase [Azospirillum oleiclasticum]NYZ23388.1 glycosyltransferase [Azospirillum oleiclasticum]